MKNVKCLLRIYFTTLLLFVVQKPLFLIIEHHSCPTLTGNEVWHSIYGTIWHGLSLDISTAGYLCVIPCLILLVGIWFNNKYVRHLLNGYFWIAATLIGASFVLNLALYPYWNFPLDSTPLFYFFSSPADAFASTSLGFDLIAIASFLLLTFAIWYSLHLNADSAQFVAPQHKICASACMAALAIALFVAIRGGVTVSTTNTGKAYYSQNAFLNHAAVNPLFSLLESLAHQEDFGEQYRFMSDKEASAVFSSMISGSDKDTQSLLNENVVTNGCHPDILFVIMEGFANDMLPSVGTQGNVAVNLDSIAHQSIFFTNFYANSFRTDRGIVAVLSGYPAQPIHSIMKYPAKSAHLPSIARSLKKAKGYTSAYYYGGDVDFANQRSWLVSQGYQKIISDADFPIKDKLSKWGVPDHIVAQRLIKDIKAGQKINDAPRLMVFQTSSSHEPFDVPYHRLQDLRLNAFAYTDSVIGNLLKEYSKLPKWENTLVILVPDHVGAYKENLNNFVRSRYEIPLIITGGAIAKPMKIDAIGTQHDIAATLLGQLGIDHSDFTFSKNLMSSKTPKFAFFTVPDAYGVVTEENSLIYDNKSHKAVYNKGSKLGYNEKRGQAYLQKLYDDISKK